MKPILSATVNNINELQGKFPLYGSPKLDGIRALVINGQVVSRNLKPIPNKFVQKTLQRELNLRELEGLDGELIVGDPTHPDAFRRTTSGIMSVEGNPDFTFWIFDKYDCQGFEYRYRLILQICKALKHERVKPVPHVILYDAFETRDYEEKMLQKGFEGIMLRRVDGAYKFGRSTLNEGHLMKLKQFADSEAVVLELHEQMENTNEKIADELGRAKRSSHKDGKVGKKTLGSVHVRDCHSGVEFDVGSGFDDLLRQKYWDNPKLLKGKVIKYKYFPTGSKEKPRFPVFLGLRKD